MFFKTISLRWKWKNEKMNFLHDYVIFEVLPRIFFACGLSAFSVIHIIYEYHESLFIALWLGHHAHIYIFWYIRYQRLQRYSVTISWLFSESESVLLIVQKYFYVLEIVYLHLNWNFNVVLSAFVHWENGNDTKTWAVSYVCKRIQWTVRE